MILENKKVLIIGGSSGIGLGIAQSVAAAGATAVVASRSESKMAAASQQIDGSVQTHLVDLADEESIATLMRDVGPFDHLAVTGGRGPTFAPFLDLPSAEARMDFELTFWGKYFAAKYAASQLNPGGSILFISGIYSHRPHQDAVVSAASLSAVEGLCRALAVALSPTRVNAIAPALVSSNLFNPQVTGAAREEMFAGIASGLLSQSVCTPENIGQMAVSLMTNGALTGTTILMDSGYALQ